VRRRRRRSVGYSLARTRSLVSSGWCPYGGPTHGRSCPPARCRRRELVASERPRRELPGGPGRPRQGRGGGGGAGLPHGPGAEPGGTVRRGVWGSAEVRRWTFASSPSRGTRKTRACGWRGQSCASASVSRVSASLRIAGQGERQAANRRRTPCNQSTAADTQRQQTPRPKPVSQHHRWSCDGRACVHTAEAHSRDIRCRPSGSPPCTRRMAWPPEDSGAISAHPQTAHHRGSCRGHPQARGAHRHQASASKPDPRPEVAVGRGGGRRQLGRGRANLLLRLGAAAASIAARLMCATST
jgi:hypothetical protein